MALDTGSRRALLGNPTLQASQKEDFGRPSLAAIEAILQRLDGEGMPSTAMPMVLTRARRAAAEWRDDREAAVEIEARLDRGGFDAIDINAEGFVQARELFDMFDQLMIAAQRRRIGLLREISIRHEFVRRVRRVYRVPDSL